jgi:hypothetical protein
LLLPSAIADGNTGKQLFILGETGGQDVSKIVDHTAMIETIPFWGTKLDSYQLHVNPSSKNDVWVLFYIQWAGMS